MLCVEGVQAERLDIRRLCLLLQFMSHPLALFHDGERGKEQQADNEAAYLLVLFIIT